MECTLQEMTAYQKGGNKPTNDTNTKCSLKISGGGEQGGVGVGGEERSWSGRGGLP